MSLTDFEKINEVSICGCGVVVCRYGVVVVSLWCRCSAVVDVALKRHRTNVRAYNTGLEHKLCSFICSGTRTVRSLQSAL